MSRLPNMSIRIDPFLRDQISRAAKLEGCSRNEWIVRNLSALAEGTFNEVRSRRHEYLKIYTDLYVVKHMMMDLFKGDHTAEAFEAYTQRLSQKATEQALEF